MIIKGLKVRAGNRALEVRFQLGGNLMVTIVCCLWMQQETVEVSWKPEEEERKLVCFRSEGEYESLSHGI